MEITASKLPIRTIKDGHWKKYTYQDLSYAVTLSGLLTFDEENWTGWDMLDNQFNFAHVLARVSFEDADGNIRTVQGYMMIETSTLSYSPSALVKDDFQMQGNGKLDMFDGLVPCPSEISGITFSGLDDPDGNVTVNYTYTGAPYQIKYRIDDVGDYIYAIVNGSISLAASSIGDHSIEIIPVCLNGYEGGGETADYNVTHDIDCPAEITNISISGTYVATNSHTGPASIMRYRIDGGMWSIVTINTAIPLGGLSAGNHTIEEQPGCTIGRWGTGFTKNFTIASQPAQSSIAYMLTKSGSLGNLQIYVNGTLMVNQTLTGAGSISAATGSTVRAVLTLPTGGVGFSLHMETFKDAISVDNQIAPAPDTLEYIFSTADGSAYTINGIIS